MYIHIFKFTAIPS